MSIISRTKDDFFVNFGAVFAVLKMNLLYILLAAFVLGAASYGVSYYAIPPKYQASVSMYINNKQSGNDTNNNMLSVSDLNASAQLVKTYSVIIKSKTVLKEVQEKAGVDINLAALRKEISVGSVEGTEVLGVVVTDTDPKAAARIANAIIDVVPGYISDIVEGSSMKIIERSEIPEYPVSPNYKSITQKGFLVGFLLGMIVVLIRAMIDDSVKSEGDFQQWDYPLLGSIPDFDSKAKSGNSYYK